MTSFCDGIEHLQRYAGPDCPGMDEALLGLQMVARFVDTCRDDEGRAA